MSTDEVDDVDELGPVDWIVVESRAASSTGKSHLRCSTWSSVI
jgi:hypothetical protein